MTTEHFHTSAPATSGREAAMATTATGEVTPEADGISTSFDPYGQLVRVLMPRASYIAIYDRLNTPLWLSDGYDGTDLLQLVEESLNAARGAAQASAGSDGFAYNWDGSAAYVFILRDGTNLLGALAVSCQDGNSGARSFALVHGLLRPALQVLARELANQYNIGNLRKDLTSRTGDLDLLLGANGAALPSDSDDLEELLRHSVTHLECAFGALLIPERQIALCHSVAGETGCAETELLEKMQRHLLAWVQVQRRTLLLNKAPPSGPLGTVPYKILACPIRHGVTTVDGMLLLFKRFSGPDFDMRQARMVEMLARRMAHVVQSIHDPATGLLTRVAFEQRALAVLKHTEDVLAEHCVAYADVDRLHVVNENHGMHVGDEALGKIAATLRARLSTNVIASRISGDRFALFFPNTGVDAASQFVTGLCAAIGEVEFKHDDRRIDLSVSFGLAEVAKAERPLSHALAAAEVACKAAKDRGRGRVAIYHDADRSLVRRFEDVTIVGELREAILNDRFRMEAQPIVQLRDTGTPRRFELLLRMINTAGECVMPDKFLSAAERYQLAGDIDRWVVRYALEVLSSVASSLAKVQAHFAINISGQSLGDDKFTDFLERTLREYALPPELLSFEITETAAVANIVRAETMIRRLQELGYKISLDDFGRGLSSLTYLKSLSVSELKIDGGLVRDLVGNQRSQAMVTAIVQLARAMNLKTTAECVESEAIRAAVAQLGVDYGQGFAIGRPQPLEDVLRQLLKGPDTSQDSAHHGTYSRLARIAG